MTALELLAGLLLIVVTLVDVLLTVALPRTARSGRLSRVVWRWLWYAVRGVALRQPSPALRESLLGGYGPLSVFVVLLVWLLLLVSGYGLVVFALRDQIQPRPDSLASSFYLAGTALLTLGYANDTGTSVLAKAVGLAAAATGLTVFALVITFLFSLFASFREREVEVVSLEATAGAPPSGVAFLEFHARFDLRQELTPAFDRWLRWAAVVLDTHLAYPVLAYFRSSHDHDSWLSSLAAIMDAATSSSAPSRTGPWAPPRRRAGWAATASTTFPSTSASAAAAVRASSSRTSAKHAAGFRRRATGCCRRRPPGSTSKSCAASTPPRSTPWQSSGQHRRRNGSAAASTASAIPRGGRRLRGPAHR